MYLFTLGKYVKGTWAVKKESEGKTVVSNMGKRQRAPPAGTCDGPPAPPHAR